MNKQTYENSALDKKLDKKYGYKEGSKKDEALDKKMMKKRKPKLGTGARFKQLKGKLAKKGAKNPAALAAFIGRKKYGANKFAKLSAGGKKKRGATNPFSNLGDQQAGTRYGVQKNQGVRMTGKSLLAHAMGRIVKNG